MGHRYLQLARQLEETEANLALIEERKARFVLQVDVPLQLIKEERDLEQRIATLRLHLELLRTEHRRPYRGLEPFDVEHAEFFFGRDQMVVTLLEKIRGCSFVAVVGPSGCGKSSLVRAGLMFTLAQGGEVWRTRAFKPGRDPLHALMRQLLCWIEPEVRAAEQLIEASRLVDHLLSGSVEITQLAERLQESHPDARHLLVVDQFEELYTQVADPRSRTLFVDTLLNLSHFSQSFRVMITLRADFYGRILRNADLGAAIDLGLVNVLPLNDSELRAAIECPAQKMGRVFEGGLVERILDDISGEPGDLPLLEFALTELWSRQNVKAVLTHSAYEEIGGVEEALATYAENVFSQLNSRDRYRMQRVLVQLVRPGEGTEDTRRLASREEVGRDNWDLVTLLASERLVVTGRLGESHEETVELVHEALISGWQRLTEWMAEDRGFRAWQERLRRAMRHWQEGGQDPGDLLRGRQLSESDDWSAQRKPDLSLEELRFIQASKEQHRSELEREQQRAAQLKQRAFYLGIALLVAMGLAIAAFFLARLAREQTEIAREQTEIAKSSLREEARQSRIAKARELAAQASATLEEFPQRSLLLAVESVKASERAGVLVPEAETVLRHALATVGGEVLKGRFDHLERKHRFSPQKRWLAAVVEEGVLLWDLSKKSVDRQPCCWLRRPQQLIPDFDEHIRISAEDRFLALVSPRQQRAFLWDLPTQTVDPDAKPFLLGSAEQPVTKLFFSPDERWLITTDSTQDSWWFETPRKSSEGCLVTAFAIEDLISGKTQGRSRRLRKSESVSSLSFLPGEPHRLLILDQAGEMCLWSLGEEAGERCHRVNQNGSKISSFSVSPDGYWIVAAEDEGGRKSFRLSLFDARHGGLPRRIAELDQGVKFVTHMIFSPNSRWLLAGFQGRVPKLWKLSAGTRPQLEIELKGLEGRVVRTITLDEEGEGKLGGIKGSSYESYLSVATFSPDSRWLVSGGADGRARLWNLTAEDPEQSSRSLSLHQEEIGALAISPDGAWLATAGGTNPNTSRTDNEIQLWGLSALETTGKSAYRVLRGHEGAITNLAFTADARQLVSIGSSDGLARLWEIGSKSLRDVPRVLRSHGEIHHLAMSSDDRWLAADGAGGVVHLWDLGDLPQTVDHRLLIGHKKDVSALAFDRQNQRLATAGGWDQTVRLWELSSEPTAERPFVLNSLENFVSATEFDAQSRYLAAASWDGEAHVWDTSSLDSPTPAMTLRHANEGIDVLSTSPDGRWLVTGGGGMFMKGGDFSTGGGVYLWDLKAQQPALPGIHLGSHDSSVNAVVFGNDSRQLATGSLDKTIRVWDLWPKKIERGGTILTGHDGPIKHLLITPDNSRLVSSSQDGTVRLWTLRDQGRQAEAVVLRGHEQEITAITVSHSGRWLASGSADLTVRLWDILAQDPSTTGFKISEHQGSIRDLFFDSKDEWLTIGIESGEIHRWPMDRGTLLDMACSLAGRDLTVEEQQVYFSEMEDQVVCRQEGKDEVGVRAQLESSDVLDQREADRPSGEPKSSLVDPDPGAGERRLGYLKDPRWSDRGREAVRQGKYLEAYKIYVAADASNPSAVVAGEVWGELCWLGSLAGLADAMLDACEHAVASDPRDMGFRDSRGIARALAGNLGGAVADFKFFLQASRGSEQLRGVRAERRRWIDELEAGRSPFDEKLLESLQSRTSSIAVSSQKVDDGHRAPARKPFLLAGYIHPSQGYWMNVPREWEPAIELIAGREVIRFEESNEAAQLRIYVIQRDVEDVDLASRLMEAVRSLHRSSISLRFLGEPRESETSDALLVDFELDGDGGHGRRGLAVLWPFIDWVAVLDFTAHESTFVNYLDLIHESYNSFGLDPAMLK